MAIRQELELDTSSATAAIEAIGQLLEQTAAAFGQQLLDAIQSVTEGIPEIRIPVELLATTDLSEVVAADIEDADGTEVAIDAQMDDVDSAPFQEAIEEGASSATPQIEAEVSGELDPTGITSGLVEGIEAADGTEVAADVELKGDNSDVLDKLDEVPSEIDLETNLDTSQAQGAVADLKAETENVNLDVDTGDSSEKLKETADSAKKAGEELDGAEVAAGGLAVGAKVLAGVLAAVAASATGLFQSAVKAQSALVSFDASVGGLRKELLDVNVSGLSIDLRQLAQDLGSSDEEVLGVSQRFAQLGLSSNASAGSITKANNQLFAVAGTLRSLNPSLGDLDQIATRAGTAFISGGRAATRLGLALTDQEIRARAAELANKSMNDELDQFELFAGGASLAAEQFGDQIEESISRASENPIIALNRLKQIFGDTLEEFGKPLVAPIFRVIEAGMPAVLAFTGVMADLASAFLPAVVSITETLAPILTGLFERAGEAALGMLPSLEKAGEALAALAKAFSGVAEIALEVNIAILEGLSVVLTVAAEIVLALDEGFLKLIATLFALYKAIVAVITITKLLLASSLNPLTLALGAAVLAAGFLFSRMSQGKETFQGLSDEIIANVSSIEGLREALDDYLNSLSEFIITQKILSDNDLVNALKDLNISAQEFAGFIEDGSEGMRILLKRISETEQGRSLLEQRRQAKALQEGIDSLNESELETIRILFERESGLGNVVRAQREYGDTLQNTSKQAFEAAEIQQGLTGEVAKTVRQQFEAQGQGENYNAMLEEYKNQLDEASKAEQRRRDASGETANELQRLSNAEKELALELVFGVTSADDYAGALRRLGLEADEIEPILADLTAGMEEFTKTVLNNVPTLIDAFSRLGEEGVTTDIILEDFEKSLQATREWSDDLVRFASENKTALLQVASELGPERTRLLIDGYKGGEEALNEHLSNMLFLEEVARAEAEVAAKIGFLQSRDLYSGEYEALAELLRDKAFFGPLTREDLDDALAEVQSQTPLFGDAGITLGGEIAEGVSEGIEGGTDGVGKTFGDRLGAALKTAQSGSKTAAVDAGRETGLTVGEATTEGLVQGLGPVTGVLVSNLLQSGFSSLGTAQDVGRSLGTNLLDRWRDALLGGSGNITRTLGFVVVGAGAGNVDTARTAGALLATEIHQGFSRQIQDSILISIFALRIMVGRAAESASDSSYNAGYGLGVSLMDGFAKGISDNIFKGTLQAARAVRDAERAARDEAESDSPSKAWERLGRDLVAGLSKGLDASSGIAARSAAGVISSATPAAGSSTNINVSVPITVTAGMTADDGRMIGQAAGGEIARSLRSTLRMEGLAA